VIWYGALAAVCAVVYIALGLAVSHAPPSPIDRAGRALLGGDPHLALLFTESCYWYVFAAFGLAGIAVAVRFGAWRARIVTSIVTTLLTWQASNVLKDAFRRPRPDYWRIIHEPSYAYSSGHAMFAVVVYALWAYYVWHSRLPPGTRFVVAPLLAVWGCAVLWSRLALGAHWVTDLAGGVLLGCAALATASAVRAGIARGARNAAA